MPPPSSLRRLKDSVRRIQLITGLGFLAFFLGSLMGAVALDAFGPALAKLPSPLLRNIAGILLAQLWAYVFIPFFCLAAGRAFDVGPNSAPIGMLVTGTLFLVAIVSITEGFPTSASRSELGAWALRAVTLVAGYFLGRRAILWAKSKSLKAELHAQELARENSEKYSEFIREAERVAQMNEERAVKKEGSPSTKPDA